MKALIAATCFAILAWIGFSFWNEYQEMRARQQLEQQARAREESEARHQELLVQAQLARDAAKARRVDGCKTAIGDIQTVAQWPGRPGMRSFTELKAIVENCIPELTTDLKLSVEEISRSLAGVALSAPIR